MTRHTGERPWYFAITASAGLHMALVVAGAWILVDTKTLSRPADLEASWAGAEASQAFLAAPTIVLDLSPALPGAASGDGGAKGDRGPAEPGDRADAISLLDKPTGRSARLAVHLPTAAPALTSKWLADSRSGKGLTDLVGPVVYGPDGKPGGAGTGAGGTGRGGGMQASFFGIHTEARRVVYLVDASSSMNRPYAGEGKTRFGQMKIELAKSILALKGEQQFFIIFFNEHANAMPAGGMENAFPQSQQRYLEWAASVPAIGLTDPRPALSLALTLNPQVIYLLTDGNFPRDVQSDLGRLRQQSVEINTIAFGDPKAEKSLKPLAMRNRGRFAFVP